jgi:isoleucyl-tRNA synthetase
VHLCDYPVPESAAVDDRLSQQMELLREIASLGRSARMDAKLKVRQPLQKVEVILADTTHQAWLEAHHSLLCEELNVKEVEFTKDATRYITYLVQPNFKRLGPRVGKLMPAVKQALQTADGSSLLAQLNAEGKVRLNLADSVVELDGEDIQVRLQAKEGWAAAQGKNCVVVLATDLTPALILEGIANDVVRAVQERRKDLSCQYTDRIEIGVVTDSSQLRQALAEYKEYIAGETLAVRIVLEPLSGVEGLSLEIGDEQVTLYVRVARDIQ